MFTKFQIAASNTREGWTLWKLGTFFAIKHPSGMCHTGSGKYIAKLWNDRFAGDNQKVFNLA